MANETSYWQRCSSCKKEIGFTTAYQVCSVSTCNRKRTGMVFCSVGCWEMHLPMMRHREAYAVEKRSPDRATWQREQQASGESGTTVTSTPKSVAATPSPRSTNVSSAASQTDSSTTSTTSSDGNSIRRRVSVAPSSAQSSSQVREADLPREILIVASKLKKYIKARSGMNTSDGVMSVLSDHLRALCREAIRNAGEDGRKTVLDRDIPRPPRPS
ncbi:MAG: hypothetical protein MJE77_01305 [Proteobacteria bacterium]|nr:hypothetical protein [Pseudomonadota bacterium]